MAQIFSRGADAWVRIVLTCAALFIPVVLAFLTLMALAPTDYGSHVGYAPDQPVPFSHAHHVGELGLDCRYCHQTVENSAVAGYPSTHTCMTCHSQIWTDAPVLAPIRDSYETGEPVRWTRVHDLPDFVYFHHGVHIQAGVPCAACHGDVSKMPRMEKAEPLTMRQCIACHRDPAPNLVEKTRVFDPHPWRKTDRKAQDWLASMRVQAPDELDSCNVCHR